jgi:hypothetical protein
MDNPLKVYQWGAAWDLPSFDPYSLSVSAFLRFCKVNDTTEVECTNPGMAPEGMHVFTLACLLNNPFGMVLCLFAYLEHQ